MKQALPKIKTSYKNTNIESLNKNSINALLKIVEEPKKNLFFILIHNNETKILPTLISRCLTFKINLNFKEVVSVTNKIVNKNSCTA